MSEQTKLLMCPFCGKQPIYGVDPVYPHFFEHSVYCHHCGFAEAGGFDTKEESLAAWNHRASPAEAKIAAIREAMETYRKGWPSVSSVMTIRSIEKILEDGND